MELEFGDCCFTIHGHEHCMGFWGATVPGLVYSCLLLFTVNKLTVSSWKSPAFESAPYLLPDRAIQPVIDPADSSPVRLELLLQADLLECHEKILQHITKEQSALLHVVMELKGILLSSHGGTESIPPPLPLLSVATACPLPPSLPPQSWEHPLPVPEKLLGQLY